MTFCNIRVSACIFLLSCIILRSIYAQKCVEGAPKLDTTKRAYMAAVVIRAKVITTGKQGQTAKVTNLFAIKTGGLNLGDIVEFGPVKKGKGCKIRKNSEYILFLGANTPGTNFYKLMYDPAKLRETKKLRKVLCEGCVKPPKFKGSDSKVTVEKGKSFTFNCKVSGNPRPKAVFLKDSKVLSTKTKEMKIKIKIKKKGGGGKLKIPNVDPSHAGVYTCQASNFAGNASLSYILTVKGGNISATTPATFTTTLDAEPCFPCTGPEAISYCMNNGHCCSVPETTTIYCQCNSEYEGSRCDRKILITYDLRKAAEARYHRRTVAIMGACIALLLVILICYIVYCKFKKSRSHILKDIQKQYCPVNGRNADREEERAIANENNDGIVADDSNGSEVRATTYRSTNFNESPYSAKPVAFSQRPQTYDDVIPVMGSAASESQPLVGHKQQPAYVNRDEVKHGRRRKNGVAVENRVYGKQSLTGSDGDMSWKGARRIDELKRNRDSTISTSSSVGSHPELRKPAIPIDERLATMSLHKPPAYCDIPDSSGIQNSASSQDCMDQLQPLPHSAREELNNMSQTDQSNEHDMSSPSSAGRLHEFDSEGRTVEEISNTHVLAQPSSPTFLSDYLPKSDQNITMHSQEFGNGPRSNLPYKESIQSPPYPYYEPNAEKQPHSPSEYHHDEENSSIGPDHAGTSASFYDSHRGSQPSSPRQYQNSSGMGMPRHHAPVAVSSALTHVLPLLTQEKSDAMDDLQNRQFTSSAMSSSSADESSEPERNRDSHKIEV